MKKALVVLLALCSVVFAQQKQKTGVYVNLSITAPAIPAGGGLGGKLAAAAAEKAFGELTKAAGKTVGEEFTKLIDKSPVLSGVNLTAEIQKQVKGGTLTDAQIISIGQQFDIQLLCITDIGNKGGGFGLDVRLVDVKTAAPVFKVNTTTASNDLKDIKQLINAVQYLARELTGAGSLAAPSAPPAAPVTYSLTVSPNLPERGTVSPAAIEKNLSAGTQITLTATPAEGHTFVKWTITPESSGQIASANSPTTTVTISADATVTANFQPLHLLTVTGADGGTVVPADPRKVAANVPTEISAAPDTNHTFTNWALTSGHAVIANEDNASTSVTLLADAVIAANFQKIPRYTLTINRNPANAGTTKPAGPLSLAAKKPFRITAETDTNHRFVNWTVVSGGPARFLNADSASTTVTLLADAVIAANFQRIPRYTLTINRDAKGGTAHPASQSDIPAGKSVHISANAGHGYHFLNWAVINGQVQIANPDSANTTVTLSTNAIIAPKFISVDSLFTLTVDQNAVSGGTVQADVSRNILPGKRVKITAEPLPGHKFVNWVITSGTSSKIINENSAGTTVIVNAHTTVTANFIQAFSLKHRCKPTNGGTINVSTQSDIPPRTPTDITAIPKQGYEFTGWAVSGGHAWFADVNDPNTSVILASDAIITANFQQTRAYTLTVDRNAGPTRTLTTQTGIIDGWPVNISAPTMTGYKFVNWTITGGTVWISSVNEMSTTVSLGSDASIMANYEPTTSAGKNSPMVLATFGIGGRTLDYKRKQSENEIPLRDMDRTVTDGTSLDLNILLIAKSGLTLSTGTSVVIGDDEGVNIDPQLGLGYVYHNNFYIGGIINFIANSHVISSTINSYNDQRGDLFVAPTFLLGYNFGSITLGGEIAFLTGTATNTSGSKFAINIGINATKP